MSLSVEGPGFFPAFLGQTFHNGRYKIVRKLSSGIRSTTWLVERRDVIPFELKYLAAKILTLDATRMIHNKQTYELQTTSRFRDHEDSNMCFITYLLSTDVSSFRNSAPTKALAPYIVKNILSRALTCLVGLHELDIVHTDIKLDNIPFGYIPEDSVVDQYLAAHPAVIQGEYELDGQKYPVLPSQPLPHEFTWDTTPYRAECMLFMLVDMGQAQWTGTPILILRSDFGPKVDIWAIGCVTFELLVGNLLFDPKGGEGWRSEDDHLAKMMELTGERFSKAVLERSRRRNEYFDDKGNLFKRGDLQPTSLEEALEHYNLLPAEEIGSAASFIRACLHLDPTKRASAKDLIVHLWLRGACYDGCCTHPTSRLDPDRATNPITRCD